MTIKFNCPKCDELIAFDEKHIGKRARCYSCGQIFIIPAEDNQAPRIIKPPKERAEPLPGFYRALFVDSWKVFNHPQSATALGFVLAVVCFNFFFAQARYCCGSIISVVIWGWLLGFYLNIIYGTAHDIDELPRIYLGTSITFLWHIFQPLLIFITTMAVVQLPYIITLVELRRRGVIYENIWVLETGPRLLLQVFFIVGLFVFPIAVLTMAIGRDFTMLRPDYLFKPIFKAFMPYLVIVFLLVATGIGVVEMQTRQYEGADLITTALHLALNLAVQPLAIITMRSIGLFHRHYSCHLPW